MRLLNKLFGRKEVKSHLDLVQEDEDRLVLSTLEHGDRIEFRYEPIGPSEPHLIIGYFDAIKGRNLLVGNDQASSHRKRDIVNSNPYGLDKIFRLRNLSDDRFDRERYRLESI